MIAVPGVQRFAFAQNGAEAANSKNQIARGHRLSTEIVRVSRTEDSRSNLDLESSVRNNSL